MNTLNLQAIHHGYTVDLNSLEDYNIHSKACNTLVYIKGNRQENLFNALYELSKHNAYEWFALLKQYKKLGTDGQAAVRWLMVMLPKGYSMENAIRLAPKVTLYHGYEIDYVTQFVNESFNMKHKLGHLVQYFDYAGYCFDLQRDRKIDKVIFERMCYTITNASDFNVWGV